MSMANRRKEDRYKGEGEVRLFFEDPTRQEVNGSLLDYSNSGFRAAHTYAALPTGQVVDFQHVVAVGQAKVMWNRIADDRVESGFLIIK